MTRGVWSCCESLQPLERAGCEKNRLLTLSVHHDRLAVPEHVLEMARGAPGTNVDVLMGAPLPLTHQEVPCHCPHL